MNTWPLLADVVQVLGWTLLHFLWQATLIGVLYALLRSCFPRGGPRYLLGMLSLLALTLCPILTAWRLSRDTFAVTAAALEPVTATFVGVSQATTAATAAGWEAWLAAAVPWLVLAWIAGVAFLSVRIWRHWCNLKSLLGQAQTTLVWQARVSDLASRFGLHRGIRVLSSARVGTPTLVGWIRPVILLPLAVSCGFPVAQVELILAHELAHLKRFDHFANLFQVVLETLLFYHPVVHWISRDVRDERELCCDQLALQVTGGSRREFAAALVELEEFRGNHAGLTLAASGGVLTERVGQLTGSTKFAAPQPVRFVGVTSSLLLALLLAALLWQQAALRSDLADSATAARRVRISHLLPASIRMPAQAIANLVPDRLDISIPDVAARMVAPPAAPNVTDPPAVLSAQTLRIAKALQIADLAPPRMLDVLPVRVAARQAPAVSENPVPLHIQHPVYPLDALQQGVEGNVVVEFALNVDGSVRQPRVVNAQPGGIFDSAAVVALRGWEFAAPLAADANRRYRQTFTFTLHPALETAGNEIAAKPSCYVMTGTHICRARSFDDAFVSGTRD